MFEALVTLCLSLADGPCRPTLLPGYGAPDRAACEAALAARPPALPPDLVPRAAPACAPAGPALPVTEVAPGVFVHVGRIAEPDKDNRGDVANLGFVVGEASVAVIDTGSARWVAEALWRAIRARTDRPVSHVVLTHFHPDHALGVPLFAEAGAQVVAHAALPRALADRQANYAESLARLIGAEAFLGSGGTAVDLVVEGTLTLDLGNRDLVLHAWPTGHTGADLTALDPATGTLFAGDLVFDGHVPALDGSVTGWRAVLTDLQALGAVRVVPGHGAAALPWPEGAADTARYLSVLEADTRAALEAGQRLGAAVETIASEEAPHWQLFDAYNRRNATQAFTELEWE